MAGRPPKFANPDEMQPLIDEYFNMCDEKGESYTVPGLALALGFCNRQKLWDCEQKSGFGDTIKRAKSKIESQRVSRLVDGKGNVIGCIFDLKNNFGYKDQQQVELSNPDGSLGGMKIAVCFVDSEKLPEPLKQIPGGSVDAEFETLSGDSEGGGSESPNNR